MKYNIWVFIFDSFDIFYRLTNRRLQTPIEYIFPDFCPWLFSKMIGKKRTRIE